MAAKLSPQVGVLRASSEQMQTASSISPSTDQNENRCRRCGRVLYSELARAAGFGGICAMSVIARRPLRGRDPWVSDPQLVLPLGGDRDE